MRVSSTAHRRGLVRRCARRRGLERGLTLLEVTATLAFFAVAMVGVSGGLFHGVRTTRELRERQLVKARAQIYLNRVMSLNFGQATDPRPTGAQLDELFDDDNDLGSATLMALTQPPAGIGGWKFRLQDFPVNGEWLVVVTRDLDGDGTVAGDLETGGNLVRIVVSFEDEALLGTVRGKETQT